MGNIRKYVAFLLLFIILCVMSFSAAGKDNQTKERYIVKLKTPIQQGVSIQATGAEKLMELESINAIVVSADAKQFDDLKNDSNVEYIQEDREIKIMEAEWGVLRIGADKVWPFNNGSGIKVAIIDTGIDYTHPDLNDNYKGGYNIYYNNNDPMDYAGHGTHVAGIVAAELNGFGVVGVAPQASLYAVKVFPNNGSPTPTSIVIEGIAWAINNNMNVISMSLGGGLFTTSNCDLDDPAMTEVINNAVNAGIVVVVAAGNSPDGVSSPGCISKTIVVGATDSSNSLASFSGRGAAMADHGVVAPGVYTRSTYLGNTYAYMSGTSMATPHVSGAVALLLNSPIPPQYDTNNNGKWDPLEVRKRLQDTALDLGAAGNDNNYGYGLINISAAASTQPPGIIFFDNVESGTNGWTSTGLWHVTTRRYSSTSHSWWYGQESTGNYNTGKNSGYLTSQAISLVGVIDPKLSFMSWYQTETGTTYDKKFIQISANGGVTWTNLKQISDAPSQWNLEIIDLSSYADQTIKIRYFFDTVDGLYNNYEGWYIDDVKIETPVPLNPLYVSVSESPDPVTSGNISAVTVHVNTTGGVNVSNASVDVSVTGGVLNPITGATDVNGDFKSNYTALIVTGDTTYTISATASRAGYANGVANDTIIVKPGPPLYVSVSEIPDPVTSGNTSIVAVHVNTTGGANVSNASVSVSATGGILNPTTGTTDANGDFKSDYTAPEVIADTTYTISAAAFKQGYTNGSGNGTITVNILAMPPGIVFFDNVESGTNGWTNTGLWHITARRSNSSSHSWWYGQESTGNYDTGSMNSGYLTSQPISLIGVINPKLSFMSWYKTEDTGTAWDKKKVQISTDGGATWTDLKQITDAPSQWNLETIDLSGYVGQTIKIRYFFDTVDKALNNFEGWYIDDVKIETPVPLNPLYISVSESPDPVTSGNTSKVTVHVSTTGGVNVSNASVNVSVTGGTLSLTTGTTNANGDFMSNYTAPSVTINTTFTISATASKTGYASSAGNGTITVNPGPPLYVSVSESPDPVTSGNTSVVTVHVNTTGGTNVSNASVNVSVTGGILNPTTGTTDVNGDFKSNYTAPIVTGNTTFTISATASRAGYANGTGNSTITVNPSLIPGIIFFDDIESGQAGWTNTSLWHITTKRSNSSSHSWWYGQESTGNYNTGKSENHGYLTSQDISLVGTTSPKLSFARWYQVEGNCNGCNPKIYDQMIVQISADGGSTWTQLSKILDSPYVPQWKTDTIDLSSYSGKTIKIRFFFATIDYYANNYEGWYIDDVKVVN